MARPKRSLPGLAGRAGEALDLGAVGGHDHVEQREMRMRGEHRGAQLLRSIEGQASCRERRTEP